MESVVVTLQDMAPLEELERLRAEFLGMVSHELRAPLTSIKGSTATVLGAARVLEPAEVRWPRDTGARCWRRYTRPRSA